MSARPAPRPDGAASATLAQRLVAAGFVAASTCLSALPRGLTLPVARAIGRLTWVLLPGRRRIALENLRAALGGELSEPERRRIARASFGHAAAIAMDLLTLPRVARDPRAVVDVAPGSLELLHEARARGRGVILLAGHFGLFESMGIVLGHEGFPVTFVAKPFDNPRLDEAVNARRRATGNDFIHKGGAKARARAVLDAGGLVAIVVDQHVSRRDRLWVPFFGLPAATTRSLGTLALETGSPVVPIHAFPLPRGRVRCEFGPVLEARRAGDPVDTEADAERLVHEAIRCMEEATRRMPEAWLWLHRRWKVRPDDAEPGRYPAHAITESQEAAKLASRHGGPGAGAAAVE